MKKLPFVSSVEGAVTTAIKSRSATDLILNPTETLGTGPGLNLDEKLALGVPPSPTPYCSSDLQMDAEMLRRSHRNLTDGELAQAVTRVKVLADAALGVKASSADPREVLTAKLNRIAELHRLCPNPLALGDAAEKDKRLRRDRKVSDDTNEECDALVDSLVDWYGPEILLEDIEKLQAWFDHFTRNRQRGGEKKARNLLGRFFRGMRGLGHCPWDLSQKVHLTAAARQAGGRRRSRKIEILSVSQVRHLLWLAMCERPDIVPLLVVLIFAGLRPQREALGANYGTDAIHISAELAKTRKPRDVEIGDVIKAWWIHYPQAGKIAGSFKYSNARRILRRLMKKAGIKLSSNIFRHTFSTITIATTGDLTFEAAQAGHGLIAQQLSYNGRLTPEDAAPYFLIMPPPGWQPVVPYQARRAAGRKFVWQEVMTSQLPEAVIHEFLNPQPQTTPTEAHHEPIN